MKKLNIFIHIFLGLLIHPNEPYGIYLDYGLVFSSSGASYNTQWSVPAAYQKEILESINLVNPLPIIATAGNLVRGTRVAYIFHRAAQ